jgi:hypothetical protein
VSGLVTLVMGDGNEAEEMQPRRLKERSVVGVVGERFRVMRTGWWFGSGADDSSIMGVAEATVEVEVDFLVEDEDEIVELVLLVRLLEDEVAGTELEVEVVELLVEVEVEVDFLVEEEDETFELVLLVPLLEDEVAGAELEVEVVFLSNELVLVACVVDVDVFVDELDCLGVDDEVVVGVDWLELFELEVVLVLVVGANPRVYTST